MRQTFHKDAAEVQQAAVGSKDCTKLGTIMMTTAHHAVVPAIQIACITFLQ